MAQLFLIEATLFLMLAGLAGVFLPLLPGIELIWLAALGFGILHGFTWKGGLSMAGISLLLLVGLSSDIWITGLGLKSAGTSLVSVLTGTAALLIGSLLLTPPAGIAIGLAVLVVLEFLRHRDWKKAVASAGSALAGCGLSYGFKFFVGLLMMGIWIVWLFLGG
jgi:uncharacterized protein YqgC (DUF456 family)